jgi:hypothetical protein
LCYKFQRKKDITVQEYQEKFMKNEIGFEDFEAMSPVASMNVVLNT